MNCLRMDLRRSIFCKKFVLIVMATLLVLFASTWNEFQSYTWWGDSTGMQGCVNILYNSLAYDKFKVVIVFLFGGIYTGSYCSDENSRYLRSILNRTTLLSYTISRFLVNFIAIMLGMIIVIGSHILLSAVCAGLPLIVIGRYERSLLWKFFMESSDDLFNYDGTSVWCDHSCM